MSTRWNRMISKINKWMISKQKKALVSEAAKTWLRKYYLSKISKIIRK